MIDINRDTEDGEQSPFQEEIILDNYFPCACRAEVLSRMQQAIQEDAPLMALIGEEGSGKTMLCRMLAHEAVGYAVFFPHAVDAFEDIIRDIAVSLGLDKEMDSEFGGLDQSLQHITNFLLDQRAELLVIFDEAENIFLATLDRIRRMIERITGAGAHVHILLSGQKTFLENCDQISFGTFGHHDAYIFELTPLSEAETTYYLQFCAAQLPDIDAAKVFTDEAVDDIYRRAHGNFRMTNILAEEAVQPHSDETSFMVLLEGVEERTETREKPWFAMEYLHLDGKITRYLPWIGGAVCCLFLFFFLFRPDGDESEVGREVTQSSQPDPSIPVATALQTGANPAEKNKQASPAPVEELEPPQEQEYFLAAAEQNSSGPQSVPASGPAEKEAQSMDGDRQNVTDQAIPETAMTVATVPGRESTAEGTAAAKSSKQEAPLAIPVELSSPVATRQVQNIARLRPGSQLKKKNKLPVAQQSLPSAMVRTVVASPNPAADRLYKSRLLAGSSWKGSEKKKMFTVQVMALNSKDAEKNLKSMLAQLNYRQEAGNFYIFEKQSAPEKVYVFYGEYPSMDMARLAQNSLPQFLRDHKPRALPINEAVAKLGW